MNQPVIYLDNNATTKLDLQVASRMTEVNSLRLANPASQHGEGRRARAIVENARETILLRMRANCHGMNSDQLIFTSGGTEANNLAIFGLASTRPGAVIVSAIEHPSVLAPAQQLLEQGREVRFLPVSKDGVARLDLLQAWIDDSINNAAKSSENRIALVSLMTANNETGVIQPISKAAQLCRQAGILFHTDAVQACGKIDLAFSEWEVDAMTISPHKLHGPVGIGGLILRNKVMPNSQLWGGFQQLGIRPGTESVALADGMCLAIELALNELGPRSSKMQSLREMLEQLLLQLCPQVQILGRSVDRLPNTLSVAIPGINRQSMQMALDLVGVECSTGSACASGSSQPSHVISAMEQPAEIVESTIRLSLSHESTTQEIELTASKIARVVQRNSV